MGLPCIRSGYKMAVRVACPRTCVEDVRLFEPNLSSVVSVVSEVCGEFGEHENVVSQLTFSVA